MVSDIGIKIANGEFYPILEENSTVKKRLVLTTVHDNQRSVQIDLYKSSSRTMVDAFYIGSLIMENIKPRPKGEPSIELVIASTYNGEITANAIDMDVRGEHQTLNVSLKSLEADTLDAEIPDFELEQGESPPTGLYEKASKIRQEEKKSAPWLILVGIIVLLAAIGAGLWFFILNDTGAAPPYQQPAQPPAVQPAPPPPQQPPIAGQPPAQPPTAGQPPAQQPPAVAQPPAQPPTAGQPPVQQPPAVTQPPAQPPTIAQPPAQQPPAVAAPPPAPPPVIQAPAAPPPAVAPGARHRPLPPVALYNVPAVIPREGFPYRIRYGDTLWAIAEAFYRDPLLYPHIARFNNIPNPNLIISGALIYVPPRN